MNLIQRVRQDAATLARTRANGYASTVKSAVGGRILAVAGGTLGNISDLQGSVIGKAFEAINSNEVVANVLQRTGLGNLGAVLGAPVSVNRTAQQLRNQVLGRGQVGDQNPAGIATVSRTTPAGAAAAGQSPVQWTRAPLHGNLTADQRYLLFQELAMTPHAWKNLWFVSINERQTTQAAPEGLPKLNLLAMDCSFSPSTLAGEAVPIGGGQMDNLTGSERVDLRLSTLDDAKGTIKRWFDAKCLQAVHRDGTFGLPSEYLVEVQVTHMSPLNEGSDSAYYRRKWTMRPVSVEAELSRRDVGHEDVQMAFTQFDTFY